MHHKFGAVEKRLQSRDGECRATTQRRAWVDLGVLQLEKLMALLLNVCCLYRFYWSYILPFLPGKYAVQLILRSLLRRSRPP